ncbi:MAG: multifunctional oxoglutarate decarboxylase/oxoglutarate dehydrogenase thiamine pyrophosphate-binding subunit/dihydrolipoyllysine-residue succinyltransferase subunit [Bacteroidota bacterium]
MNSFSDQQTDMLFKQFGTNSAYVSELFRMYLNRDLQLPESWKRYFDSLDLSVSGSGFSGDTDTVSREKQNSNGVQDNTVSNDKSHKVSEDTIQTGNHTDRSPDKPELPENYSRISGAPARIIQNMQHSLSVPTATSQRTIPVKLLEENRRIINQHRSRNSLFRISFTHIIAFAIVTAVKKYPVMNNSFEESDGVPYLIQKKQINLGIAIDIEKRDGTRSLIVPNIRDAGTRSFAGFAEYYEALISKSRAGKIEPDDFQGTTVSLTNPGTIGTITSIPRLMTGQGLIVATGAIGYPAEYKAVSEEMLSKLAIGKTMTVTSTYDHRIIQGAESGLFLKEIEELLLGQGNFYEEIFQDLSIPQHPVVWEGDNETGTFPKSPGGDTLSPVRSVEKQARILQLINYFRVRGHLIANLNPLDFKTYYHPELDPTTYGFTIWDYDRTFLTGGLAGKPTASLREILDILQRTYCGTIGAEYMHIQNPEEKAWLQNKMEPVLNRPQLNNKHKLRILWKLATAEGFEHFLHKKFIGHKRFSLEGSETVIPVLDHILSLAAEDDVHEIVFGMAHRGRLNVLANIIGKPYEKIFSEFEGNLDPESVQGTGDVKYHLGASGSSTTRSGKAILVSVSSNPSHLEWVNPVVEGYVRAKQTLERDTERTHIIPLLIHGDAAFAGQGVVTETLNLSQLKGYRTGGTIHLIINNQIGFTTNPDEARSSLYASDAAKMVQSPIIHVNGDDPEASLWAAEIAFEYRQKFHKDVVIDLFGYRRHGHNEGDDPAYTQPLLYKKIGEHPGVKTIYLQKLLKDNIVSEKETREIQSGIDECLENGFRDSQKQEAPSENKQPKKKGRIFSQSENRTATEPGVKAPHVQTAIPLNTIIDITEKMTSLPQDFRINNKLEKMLQKRRALTGNPAAFRSDWAFGETLAFGSLLDQGISVRLSGQDSARGTFSQRHLVLSNTDTAEETIPLNSIHPSARIEALDSLLSEAAVLGFEFGYSCTDPATLVLWEAQFGDFANSAQVIIDNFIVSSFQKWEQPNNLVLLLPHGFEGQGPEHSSARIERFLTLCAQENMSVCYPTTPAQYFHLLRKQAIARPGKPLVVFTPKSLLRLPEATSGLDEFSSGTFQDIIPGKIEGNTAEKLIMVSGKLYYELEKYRISQKFNSTCIVRVEQLYPFPIEKITGLLEQYRLDEATWVQEEPENMGAWSFVFRKFISSSGGISLRYSGRPESASPASGSLKVHNREQSEIIRQAFE